MLEDFGIFLVLADKVRALIIPALNLRAQADLLHPVVALRIPHRGVGAIIAPERSHVPDASEAERQQGRPLLQRW